jgi:hypothetical protein
MLAPAAGTGAAAGTAASAGGGDPPDGPPTSVSIAKYAGNLVRVQWTNGDPDSQTQVGFQGSDASTEPTTVTATTTAGATSYETGETCSCWWWVRHIENGQVTAWVQATGCSEEDC